MLPSRSRSKDEPLLRGGGVGRVDGPAVGDVALGYILEYIS